MLIALQSLASPAVCFFGLGVIAARLRSDIRLPDQVARTLAFYLMVSIGFRGGVELRAEGLTTALFFSAGAALLLSATLPVVAYWILVRTRSAGRTDAAAIAAHYGSVSVVTFTVAMAFLDTQGVAFEGFMPAILAIMEVPAIIVALMLAPRAAQGISGGGRSRFMLDHVLRNEAVVLLLGALVIGVVTGAQGHEKLEGALVAPFYGAVAIFLLDMGMTATERFGDFRALSKRIIAFGIYMPILGGAAGVVLGTAVGLSVGGATLLGVLSASASYIAAPAAMRVALPEASPGIYLPLSLGITFPLNVVVGVPLIFAAASALEGML